MSSTTSSSTAPPAAARRSLALALAPALAAFALLAWRFDFVCDDAFISFRYARHLAAGLGLRYNPGEAPPVEGYTNLGWVLWCALAERAGLDVTVWARASSALCGAALLALVARTARARLGLDARGTAATALFLATLPAFALWATGGLATMASALAVFGLHAALRAGDGRPRVLAAVGCALAATLLRADGAGWALLVVLGSALTWWRGGRPRALGRGLVAAAAAVVLASAALVLWRLGYHEALVPNTARAKAGVAPWRLARGLDYVVALLLALPALPLALVAGALAARGSAARARELAPAAVVLLGGLAYAVWTGGDFMPFGRIVFPSLPFVALALAAAWRALASDRAPARAEAALPRAPSRPRPAALALAGACVALNLLAAFDRGPLPRAVREPFDFRRDQAFQSEVAFWRAMRARTAEWSLRGKALALVAAPGDSIVLRGIGAVGYYSDVVVHDVHGLVSPEVLDAAAPLEDATPGHDRMVDARFFFPRRPTWLGCFVMRADAPADAEIGPRWREGPLGRVATLERHPLPAGRGFPPGSELRLLRYRGAD